MEYLPPYFEWGRMKENEMNFTEFIKMVEKTTRDALDDDNDGFLHTIQGSMNLLDAAVVWKLYNIQENAEKWVKILTIVGAILAIIGSFLAVLRLIY